MMLMTLMKIDLQGSGLFGDLTVPCILYKNLRNSEKFRQNLVSNDHMDTKVMIKPWINLGDTYISNKFTVGAGRTGTSLL